MCVCVCVRVRARANTMKEDGRTGEMEIESFRSGQEILGVLGVAGIPRKETLQAMGRAA